MPRWVQVIGVGNALRTDDAAGLQVVSRLADLGRQSGIDVRTHEGDGTGLLDLWHGAEAVVLVDSVRSGAAAGTIVRVDASSRPVPVPLQGSSSHALGVAEAIELARALGRLPPTVIVYGVEGASYQAGGWLSERVVPAVEAAAGAVRREVLALLAASSAGAEARGTTGS